MNDIYRQYVEEHSQIRIVGSLINEAIYPFKSGLVTMWVEQDFYFPRAKIHIICETFENDEAIIDGEELYLLPMEMMGEWVGERAGAYFLSLMNESVPDTIVLSEN